MTKHLLAAAVAALALAGCSVDVDAGSGESEPTTEASPEQMDVAALEELVASGVTPDDAAAEVAADCPEGIEVEVDATQDCHLTVGEETVDVHFVVTEVDGDEITGADYTPYIPGDRLADTIQQQMSKQGTAVDSVQCDEELTGEKGARTTCTATAGNDEGNVEVDVTEVDGLFINFHMLVVE